MDIHEALWRVCTWLPSDFSPWGQRDRDEAGEKGIFDCSSCKFLFPLEGKAGADWGVCWNPKSPRRGLLTFEHQGCPQYVYLTDRHIRKICKKNAPEQWKK